MKYRFIEAQRIHVLVGPLSAAVGYAIAPYVTQKKLPTLFPVVSSEDITQRKRSPYIIRTGWASAQPMHPFGAWAYDQLKYRKIAMIGYDFAFGWEVAAGFQRTFEESGGQIAILGLGLIAVGYIGVFFGKLIQAAVSRQREYHADAAAPVRRRDQ